MTINREDSSTISLRDSISRAFPATPYTGQITVNDDNLDDPELDEEKEIHDVLYGKKWTDVPVDFLLRELDAYNILTEEAFGAFIAAWLNYSLVDPEGENVVREFLLSSFQTMRQFRTLSSEQRAVVRSLLSEFQRRDPSAYIKNLAADAIALIDRGRY